MVPAAAAWPSYIASRVLFQVTIAGLHNWTSSALARSFLDRERVITGAELARTLSEFATHTAEDRPAEGQILSFWASRLNDTAATVGKFPSVH